MRPGQPPIVQRLCEVCLREGQAGQGALGRGGLFDQFFSQFFQAPESSPQGQHPPLPPSVQQVDITRSFSDATRQLLQAAAHQALERGSIDLEPEHILWATLRDPVARRVLDTVRVAPDPMLRELETQMGREERTDIAPSLSPAAKRILLSAYEASRRLGSSYLGPEHILLALAGDEESLAGRILNRHGADEESLRSSVAQGVPDEERRPTMTPTLDEHGRDLTGLAREGRLDPVVGRDDEIAQTIEILSRRTKNNPVLVGDAGVGKTAIVEGIAQRIVNGEVPETLTNKRLVELDVGGMVAGTRYRGEFEERMKRIIQEISENATGLLIFIDEIHTLVGAGGAEGAVDASNMLKPALARGELHVIGATTLDEYRKNIERDAALERRFQPVSIDEPSVDETVEILFGLKDRYEAFHRVWITDEAIDAAARLSDRYVTDRFLPDKAIDLIDQASARVRLREKTPSGDGKALKQRIAELEREKDQAVAAEEFEKAAKVKQDIEETRRQMEEHAHRRQRAAAVTPEDVAEVVARATGIPVSQLNLAERERLMHLEEHLHARVVDQDEAVAAVAESIRRSRAGLADPDRPIGTFLFLGPTGVGKTELARALAETLFGAEDALVRFDMSEFQERHTTSRLVGAPPGYVGYEEAGQLTESVRRRPYSVLLFDEMEKAHPDVLNILLQLMDDGRVTDAKGRLVDFRNTVVIMTSNFGADRLQSQATRIGFRPREEHDVLGNFDKLRKELLDGLRRSFRPEFLNRIDEIVVFRPLTTEQLLDISRILLDRSTRRLEGRRIGVTFSDAVVEHLARIGYDPDFGARPLRRTIQREVENELSRRVLEGTVSEGDLVHVDLADDDRLTFEVEPGGFAEPEPPAWDEPPEREDPEPAGPEAPR